MGTITEIKDDGLTIKTSQGESAAVKVSTETHFRRDQKDAHLCDFKIGDTVMIMGEQDTSGAWNARAVATAPGIGKGEHGGGLFGGPPPNPQDMGKTFIVGELKTIEDRKLTIHLPDGTDQPIMLDENTKLMDTHGDTIQLADFKTGDHVVGIGAVKNRVFVPTELRKAPIGASTPPPGPPPPPSF